MGKPTAQTHGGNLVRLPMMPTFGKVAVINPLWLNACPYFGECKGLQAIGLRWAAFSHATAYNATHGCTIAIALCPDSCLCAIIPYAADASIALLLCACLNAVTRPPRLDHFHTNFHYARQYTVAHMYIVSVVHIKNQQDAIRSNVNSQHGKYNFLFCEFLSLLHKPWVQLRLLACFESFCKFDGTEIG